MRRLARIIVRSENRRSDNRHSGAQRARIVRTYKRTRRNDIVAAVARISMANETANRGDMENKL